MRSMTFRWLVRDREVEIFIDGASGDLCIWQYDWGKPGEYRVLVEKRDLGRFVSELAKYKDDELDTE